VSTALSLPDHAAPASLRVIICDDSATIRGQIGRMLQADPRIRVVARVANGQAAVDALKLHDVDIVILDAVMPVMDGLTALPLLLRADPGLRILFAATAPEDEADLCGRAMRLGAAATIRKPPPMAVAADTHFSAELVGQLLSLGRDKMRQDSPAASAGGAATAPAAPAIVTRPAGWQRPKLLAIGCSTGGPQALLALVPTLPKNLRVPVVITQHMPSMFTPILAGHLKRSGPFACVEAVDGMVLEPGLMVLAPGERHLLVRRDPAGLIVKLSDGPPENFCRPAVDPMLRSAAEATDGRMLAVMLTGMGHDGLEGTRAVVDRGGTAVVQDEATSVVWGMPGAVARAGLAHAVLPLSQIGAKIGALLGNAA
jgi:two-component system chemotaxis response regulator CheB